MNYILPFLVLEYDSRYIKSATPPKVLCQFIWNFTGVLIMIWRYACFSFIVVVVFVFVCSFLQPSNYFFVYFFHTLLSLRKHTYSNISKISPPKTENFQIKNSGIFHISVQNMDCGYSLEPPRRGDSILYDTLINKIRFCSCWSRRSMAFQWGYTISQLFSPFLSRIQQILYVIYEQMTWPLYF